MRPKADPVNHPAHYTSSASGIECIQVTEHMNFCVGNAVKYLWRAGLKGGALEDLQKARWYVDREIARLKRPARVEECLARATKALDRWRDKKLKSANDLPSTFGTLRRRQLARNGMQRDKKVGKA